MKSEDIILSIAFFSQTGIGVLGNSFLICLFIFMVLSGHRMRLVDTIVTQLALANCLALLLKGIPQTVIVLGLMNFLDETGCKIVFYLHRTARNLSLNMTCLLSAFQATTISPSNSNLAELKARAPKYLIFSTLFCWTFQLLFNVFFLWGIKGPKFTRNRTEIQHYGYCSNVVPSGFYASLFATILSFPDVVCLGLMVSASGYMVILLFRHHKQAQQIHITCLSPRASPETRATKTILLLVSIFLTSYSLNCILTAHMTFVKFPSGLMHTSAFLNSSYPAASPYVLIRSNSQISRYLYALCGRKIPHFDTNSKLISPTRCDCKKAAIRVKEFLHQMKPECIPKY
ncbi:vomeronasal type-1 receptor 4-like [Phascolarctos cinereus]|uniref:Vomeronasal type-1 receptor n=1 Tax=Phascolarctos cinereus TaxID=38626 RepID=A0A6P5IZK4_PHACI|nr:vomeronasal type-1 receptor 4-like [Phascolarctos cinereus]